MRNNHSKEHVVSAKYATQPQKLPSISDVLQHSGAAAKSERERKRHKTEETGTTQTRFSKANLVFFPAKPQSPNVRHHAVNNKVENISEYSQKGEQSW